MGVINRIYEQAAQKNIGMMIDLDGATLHRPPAIHDPVEPDHAYDLALQTLVLNGCPVAINTGRPEKFVHNAFPGLVQLKNVPLWISTETGAKIRGSNEELEFSKPIPDIDHIRTELKEISRPFQGVIIEDHKTCAITISMKQCSDDTRRGAYDHMLETANNFAATRDGIDIIPVWKGAMDAYIELIPHGVNKGTSTAHIMSHAAFQNVTTIAFGDSLADAPMMAMVRNRGGMAVGVGTYLEDHLQDINLTDYHEAQKVIVTASKLASGELTLQRIADSRQRLSVVGGRDLNL